MKNPALAGAKTNRRLAFWWGIVFPLAGLAHKEQDADGTCCFSAFRFHEEDPIHFRERRLRASQWAAKS
jgi:hypothetical protein